MQVENYGDETLLVDNNEIITHLPRVQSKVQDTHISKIVVGDIVINRNGDTVTVGNKDLKKGFMGTTLFGDSYKLGTVPVKKVIQYVN